MLTASVEPGEIPLSLSLVPFGAHGFYLLLLFWLGLHRRMPLLLVVALAMLAVGLFVHAVPYLHRRLARPTTV